MTAKTPTAWANPDNLDKEQLSNKAVVRRFEAYIQFLPSLEDLFTAGLKPKEITPEELQDSSNQYLDVIGFSISLDLNGIPTCAVSMPSGKIVRNAYDTDKNIQVAMFGRRRLAPVSDKDTYETMAVANAIKYKAVIIWFKEYGNDTDYVTTNKGTFKPIFKGVIKNDTFTKIAQSQSGVNLLIQHWAHILDNVILRNVFVNTQSSSSAHVSWLHRDIGSIDGKSKGPIGNSKIAAYLAALISRENQPITLNSELCDHLIAEVGVEREYQPMYNSISATDEASVKTMVQRNLAFAIRILEFIKDRYVDASNAGYSAKPEFTDKNVGLGKSCSTSHAFRALTDEIRLGGLSGQTILQCLTKMCAGLCLDLVCTSNCITLEPVNYRPKKWALPVITNAVNTVQGNTFAREIAITVGAYSMSSPFSGKHNQGGFPNIVPKDVGGVAGNMWGLAYLDPTVDPNRATLASMVIFDMPWWFARGSASYSIKTKLTPAVKTTQLVLEEPISDPIDKDQDIDAEIEAEMSAMAEELQQANPTYAVAEIMHYKAKTAGNTLSSTLPLNLNIVQGMPICLKGVGDTLYYSGVVTKATHKVNQAAMLANTEIVLSYVESFSYTGTGLPTENPNNPNGTDLNPLYYNSNMAFKQRPLYF